MNKVEGQLLNPGELEPWNLKQWPTRTGQLWSCARPGRGTYKTKKVLIDAVTLRRWLDGLPSAPAPLHIISLLGEKPPDTRADRRGTSEFIYYPFRSACDPVDGRPTFQEWLGRENRPHIVREFPTVDSTRLSGTSAGDAAIAFVRELLRQDMRVLVVDSGGVQRTGELCRRVLAD